MVTCKGCRAVATRVEQSVKHSNTVTTASSLLNNDAIETVLRDSATLHPMRQLAETWQYAATKLDNPSEAPATYTFLILTCMALDTDRRSLPVPSSVSRISALMGAGGGNRYERNRRILHNVRKKIEINAALQEPV